MLIAARVVQGAGAALMNPATLSIIAATFPPKERGMAIGIWAGTAALALAIGPLVGGLLTEHLSWHWIFFVNIPVGIVAIAASFLLITESKDETHVSLDLPGPRDLGARPLRAHVRPDRGEHLRLDVRPDRRLVRRRGGLARRRSSQIERRRRAPMLDLTLFRSGTYAGANIAMLLVALAMFGVFFFVSLYMQNVLGYSAVQAGAAFLPMTILIILVAPIAGKAVRQVRLALADDDRDGAARRPAALPLAARRRRELLEPAARLPRRRSRDVADDDADRGRGDAGGAGREVGRRLGGAERDAAGRRLARDRADGRDRRRRRRTDVPASTASWRASSAR